MPAIDLAHAGLVVVDLDVGHTDGADGIAAFDALVDKHGDVPPCPVVRTPSGGAHLYLKQPSGRLPLGNAEGALPDGIDIRGAGGYVIGPDAVRDDGTFYEHEAGTPCLIESFRAGSIPAIPAWLAAIIDQTPERPDVPARCPSSAATAAVSDARCRKRALDTLRYCYDELAGMSKDSGRNNCLNGIAFKFGRMAARGWITEAEVFAALWDACIANGLMRDDGRRQCLATFRSGFGDGLGEPALDPIERLASDPAFAARLRLKSRGPA